MVINYFKKKKNIKLGILVLSVLFFIPLVSSADLVLDFNYPQQIITQTVNVNTNGSGSTNTSNSSDFWDNLDTPTDILGSQINNDLGWITSAGAEPLWNGNFSIVAKIGDCPAGQFVQNTTTSGVQCATASGSGDITDVQGDNTYVYNGSTSGDVKLAFNETKLNATIDLRASASGEPLWTANYSTFLTHINWATAMNGTLLLASNKTLQGNYSASIDFCIAGGNCLSNSGSSEPNWNANYSTFLTKINWSQATNGTLMLASNWNATNTSYYLTTNPSAYWNNTFATFNKTYADTLYLTNTSNFGNCTSGQHIFGFNSAGVKVCTADTTGTESDPLWSANYTAYNSSWSSTYNSTYNTWAYNQTTPAVNTILGFSYYNLTNFDINNYYLKSNPFGFYNSTNPPTETLWNANYSIFLTHINWATAMNGTLMSQATYNTNYSTLAVKSLANEFTENQTMEGIKLEGDTTNHVIYDNATCVYIKGDTSTLEIC